MVVELFSSLKAALEGNQFFSGGFVLLALGAVGAAMRKLPAQIWAWALRRLTVTVEVTGKDDAFYWLLVWLSSQGYTKRARRWMVASRSSRGDTNGSMESHPNGDHEENKEAFLLVPAPGQHLFRYKSRWLWLSYSREPMTVGNNLFVGYHERMFLRILGRHQEVVNDLLNEARVLAEPEEPQLVHVRVALWGSWRKVDSRKARPLSSLVFDDGMADRLLLDITEFRESRDWYLRMGIPYHRGYLLSGPPGNGKSSLVMALAGELGLGLCIAPLDPQMADERFRELLLDAPDGSVILLEDIDKIPLCASTQGKDDDKGKLSLSAILNALDGVIAREGQLVFMTANDLVKIHPALLRPGRADVHLELRNASRGQASQMYARFYDASRNGDAIAFGAMVEPLGISMAAVQEHLLRNRWDPEAALASVPHNSTSLVEAV